MEYCCCGLVTKSCPTLCNPMDCSPPGSSFHGISQAKTLEWVSFPNPGDLPDPGLERASPAEQVNSLLLSHQGSPIVEYYAGFKGKESLLYGTERLNLEVIMLSEIKR